MSLRHFEKGSLSRAVGEGARRAGERFRKGGEGPPTSSRRNRFPKPKFQHGLVFVVSLAPSVNQRQEVFRSIFCVGDSIWIPIRSLSRFIKNFQSTSTRDVLHGTFSCPGVSRFDGTPQVLYTLLFSILSTREEFGV